MRQSDGRYRGRAHVGARKPLGRMVDSAEPKRTSEEAKMATSSASDKILSSGSSKVEEKQISMVSTSHIVYHFGTSGIAVATATGITHPLDVLKVRLQMQLVGQRGPITGMGKLFTQILKTEGHRALYLGLTPAMTRSVLYGGLRLGLYEPSKYICDWAFGFTNVLMKVASGAFAGAIATALTNPTEVLKVRLQMNSNMGKGGAIREVRQIASEEGIKAFWKGVGPAMGRAAMLTASQMATYDESKQIELITIYASSSTIAGAVSTIVTAPMDMIKTRLMLQQESKRVGGYRNGFHCAYQVMRTEGPLSLYKGGFAIFARLGPQTMITFLVCEKLRDLAGLKAI